MIIALLNSLHSNHQFNYWPVVWTHSSSEVLVKHFFRTTAPFPPWKTGIVELVSCDSEEAPGDIFFSKQVILWDTCMHFKGPLYTELNNYWVESWHNFRWCTYYWDNNWHDSLGTNSVPGVSQCFSATSLDILLRHDLCLSAMGYSEITFIPAYMDGK